MTRAEAINQLKNDGPLNEEIIIMWWNRDSKVSKDEWSDTVSNLSIEMIQRLLKKSGLIDKTRSNGI